MAEDKLGSLPEDLLLDIVTKRLSGEAIRAFRCVCKTWRSYIVKHFDLINHGRYMVFDHGTRFYMSFTWDYTQVGLYSFNGCSNSFAEPTELKFPPLYVTDYRKLVGYSNGLACLVQSNHPSYDIALWNPSINTIQIVPKSLNNIRAQSLVLGFGFVPQTKDYKVVRLLKYFNQSHDYSVQVEVYSLKSDSWKTVSMRTEYTDYLVSNQQRATCNTFVKGCAHWVARRMRRKLTVILCFDMVEEVFHEIDTPAPIDGNRLPRLTSFQDSLALFASVDNYKTFDVWVMKDYGVSDTWSRLYSVTGIHFCNAYEIMDNEKILAIGYYKTFSYYDPVTEERIELKPRH